ncbi:hypothetical protein EBT31_19095, partial [bacterium]|nr:hypothetical protein [bacterium]
RTLDFPITFNGVGGTFQLAGNLTLGTTRAITLTAGTLDLNNFTFTGASLSSNGTGVRSLQFGTTGQITLVGNAATILDFTTATNFTYTGTLRIYSNYNGATGTRTFNFGGTAGATTTNDFDVSIGTSGTGLVIRAGTDSVDLAGVYNNVDLTGLTMTIPNSAKTIYGNLTIPGTGGALTAGANALTFAGTGTQTITTNGRTLDFPITINGVGGTFQLQDNLLQGTTRAFTHTNGTLNLNGKTLTVGTTYTTAAGTKNLTFNGGTLICPAASVTSFNNAVPAGFTTTAGSGTGTISMTAATAKTFVGGGVTYNCDIDNNGAGALTITGINTFNTIKSSYANATANTSILLPAGNTTITVGIVGGSASNKILALSTAANTRANVVISNASIQTASFLSTNSIVFIAGTLPTDGSVPWRWYLANSVNNGDTFGAVFQRYNIDAPIIYYIRSGTTFKVPYDWNNANNSVHLYGGG